MKNYKIVFSFTEVEHSEEDMMKSMSNMIAFNGSLYMLDYHGYGNGSGWAVEDGVYKLTIIVNKDYGDGEPIITPEDIVLDVKDEIQRRNYRIYKWNVKIFYSEESIEIPEDYVDQYFARSYFDIEGIDI
jgi:hypothetical protein